MGGPISDRSRCEAPSPWSLGSRADLDPSAWAQRLLRSRPAEGAELQGRDRV